MSWTLCDGEQRHEKYPDRFALPARKRRHTLKVGDLAKLLFETEDEVAPAGGRFGGAKGERMWVEIVEVGEADEADGVRYIGELGNKPFFIQSLELMQRIEFAPKHVIDIDRLRCIECSRKLPAFDKSPSELADKGWRQKPHSDDERVQLNLCPTCVD